MTWLATALHVAKRVTNWEIMVWCVELVESAYRATMPCVMLYLTLLHQLALPHSKKRGLSSQATTGAQLTSSCGTGVEVEMPLWMSPSPIPSKMTLEQVQQPHQAMQLRSHMTAR